jgi:CxxC motif-containing protein
MVEKEKIICVTCPKGCTLELTHDGITVIEVKPGCKRGHQYAANELADPRRMVATTVRVKAAVHPLLPVYTSAPFPKGRIQELRAALQALEIRAPVKMGQVIVANLLDTGIDIIASRDLVEVR